MVDLVSVLTPALLPVLYFSVVLVLTWLIARLASLLVGRLMSQSAPLAAAGARRLAAVIVWLVGGTLAIQLLGVSPEILFIIVGLLGVAALLALRAPLENYGAKYFSDVYVPFKVGDSIRVGDFSGKVIEINPMATVLLTEADTIVSVPNAKFLEETVVNTSPQAWKEITLPLSLSGSADVPAFESDLMKSLAKLRTRLDRRFPPVLAIKSASATATELVLTVMIRRPEDREAILAEVSKRVAESLVRLRAPVRTVPAPRPSP